MKMIRTLLAIFATLVAVHPLAWGVVADDQIKGRPEATFNSVNAGQVEGEHLDTRTLTLNWETADLVIPGNGGLDLMVARSYAKGVPGVLDLGNWNLEVPRIQIQVPPNGRIRGGVSGVGVCEDPHPEDIVYLTPNPAEPQVATPGAIYLGPLLLLIPGEQPRTLSAKLPGVSQFPAAAKYVTTDNWIVRCVNSGTAFEATSPRGTRYLMDLPIQGSVGDYMSGLVPGHQVYGASTVTDVKGNSLTYTYAANPKKPQGLSLQSIVASDGRTVTFNYYSQTDPLAAGKLQSFSFGARTWTFGYEQCTWQSVNHVCLADVSLPEGLQWSFDTAGQPPNHLATRPSLSRVTIPSGATIDYTYNQPVPNRGWTIQTRVVSGTSMPTGTWTFVKTMDADYEIVIATGPVRKESYVFHRGWHDAYHDNYLYQSPRNPVLPGLLKSLVVSTVDDMPLRIIDATYPDLPAIGNMGGVLLALYNQVRPVPMGTRTITEGVGGLTYTTTWSNFDSHGMPQTVVETGDASRQTNYTYFSNLSPWIAGVLDSEEVVGEGIVDRTFFSDGSLQSISRFGISESYDYYASGDMHHRNWTRDGQPHSITYSDYYRGVARMEQHPLSVTLEREVNGDGTVKSSKDPLGNVTNYEYDGLKRPTRIAPPGTAAATVITWPLPTKFVSTRGNYEKTVVADALWRTVEIKERDLARPAAESIYVRSQYDAEGRLTFKSIPSFSATETRGLSYLYDALDRRTKSTNTADGSFTTTCYTCINVSSTDSRKANAELVEREKLGVGDTGHVVHNFYRSFGDPTSRELMTVRQSHKFPSGGNPMQYVDTVMTRNALGKIESVSQGGVLRDYVYNANKLLWKIIEPETGTTEYTYDEVGNMKTSEVGSSGVTSYSYNALNRLTTINYPNATPDVSKGYYADGKPEYVDNGEGRWEYEYDNRRLLRAETLTTGGHSFGLEYEYDGNDALKKITYPGGTIIQTYPDALGQPTAVGAYASGLTYHPNGKLKTMTYGNGESLNFQLDSRNYPDTISVAKNGVSRVSMSFDYSVTGNLTSITDHLIPANSRQLRYDGVNRLTGADGPWGIGTIAYDDADNIQSMVFGSQTKTYNYLPTANRLSSVTGNVSYSLAYDAYGNITNNGTYSFEYDDASNLVAVPSISGLTYKYDGNGKRIRSSASGGSLYYVYNQAGLLMYQSDVAAGKSTEYFYAGDALVARRDFGSGVNPDYDGDGLPNHIELQLGLPQNNPADAQSDADSDGLSNLQEYLAGTELISADTDSDGMNDGFEARFGLNPFANDASADADGDGLTNLQESQLKTNPNRADTDNDGVPDATDPQPNFNPALIPIINFILGV